MNLKNLLTTEYLFSIDYLRYDRTDYALFFLTAAFLILAVLFKLAEIFSPNIVDKKFRKSFFNLFCSIGVLELLWVGARYEDVKFFGSHAAAFLVLLVGLIWFGYIAKDMAVNYRKEKTNWEKEQVKNKYLIK